MHNVNFWKNMKSCFHSIYIFLKSTFNNTQIYQLSRNVNQVTILQEKLLFPKVLLLQVETTLSTLTKVTRVRHGDRKPFSQSIFTWTYDQNTQCTMAAVHLMLHICPVQFSSITTLLTDTIDVIPSFNSTSSGNYRHLASTLNFPLGEVRAINR